MRVFKIWSFLFKHTSNTLSSYVIVQFKEDRNTSDYLLKMAHPSPHTPEATLLLRSDVKTAQSLSVPWASENDWSFKSLLLKGSELSRSMKRVHQVPINTYDRGQTVFLSQQKSSTVWGSEAHISHAMTKRPLKITWKWLHNPTQHVFHLFGCSLSSGDGVEGGEFCTILLFLTQGATMAPTGDLLLTKPRVL